MRQETTTEIQHFGIYLTVLTGVEPEKVIRTSLIRCYVEGIALDGSQEDGWASAVDANLTAEQLDLLWR